jgi:hypothetical protein
VEFEGAVEVDVEVEVEVGVDGVLDRTVRDILVNIVEDRVIVVGMVVVVGFMNVVEI